MHLYAAIGDLKETDYRNTLAIATLVELLREKGVFTEDEFRATARSLDRLPSGPDPGTVGHQQTVPVDVPATSPDRTQP
jgi:hypothetical protein